MSDSPQIEASLTAIPRTAWVAHYNSTDFEPLPVLVTEVEDLPNGAVFFLFDRKKREFDMSVPRDPGHVTLYHTFEECRSAMIEQWSDSLSNINRNARHAASVIEHLRTIPTQSFPDVLPEVPEPQVTQEEKAQEKIETSKPKVTTEPVKHSPTKSKSNA